MIVDRRVRQCFGGYCCVEVCDALTQDRQIFRHQAGLGQFDEAMGHGEALVEMLAIQRSAKQTSAGGQRMQRIAIANPNPSAFLRNDAAGC